MPNIMRSMLDFLLFDGFDPESGELALRIAVVQDGSDSPKFLRLKLRLGTSGDPLQPIKKELASHLKIALPPLWERGIKLIIQAIEADLVGPDGRNPALHAWVQTQIMHPTDVRRSTINHTIEAQAQILYEWGQRLEASDEPGRAAEIYERMLQLSPKNIGALRQLSALLRELGMIEECIDVTWQWMRAAPDELEAHLRHAEALIYIERPNEALGIFQNILKSNPMHAMAHIGAAQAKSLMGGDPFPHLDAALKLNGTMALSVLKETFDYRSLATHPNEPSYSIDELPKLLGVTAAEIKTFVKNHQMPIAPGTESARESELSRWVGTQNRYSLLPYPLHWSAPTPRRLPEID
jgi:tetratricopeptide (TPR) repeat protein